MQGFLLWAAAPRIDGFNLNGFRGILSYRSWCVLRVREDIGEFLLGDDEDDYTR